MLVCFHLIAFLAHEYFTPELQKDARDITREVVAAMLDSFDAMRFFTRKRPTFFSLTLPAKKEPLMPIVTIPGAYF